MSKWIRVSKRTPCPICAKNDWCGISEDGAVVRCMRVESEHVSPAQDGETGWLHYLDESKKNQQIALVSRERKNNPSEYCPPAKFVALWRAYARQTGTVALLDYAKLLGVSYESLKALQAVWRLKDSWVFPMSNPAGEMTGMRIRDNSGGKFSVRGSRTGLFIPTTVDPDDSDLLLICEGPTDTAAALTLGFKAIGRPSCRGGGELIKAFLYRRRDVVIMSDRDEPKKRPDGSVFLPGQEGAEALAKEIAPLTKSCKIIKPQCAKDIRQWLQNGITRERLQSIINHSYAVSKAI